ncbi:MAG: hypothetical protein U0746_20620 [Gemmataceae bacterium]
MTTVEVPTTIQPEAIELVKKLGVERQLEAILEQGRRTVRGLLGCYVDADTQSEMGPTVDIIARIDPAFEGDPSHAAWWNWRIDQYGPETAASFVVVFDSHGYYDAR